MQIVLSSFWRYLALELYPGRTVVLIFTSIKLSLEKRCTLHCQFLWLPVFLEKRCIHKAYARVISNFLVLLKTGNTLLAGEDRKWEIPGCATMLLSLSRICGLFVIAYEWRIWWNGDGYGNFLACVASELRESEHGRMSDGRMDYEA